MPPTTAWVRPAGPLSDAAADEHLKPALPGRGSGGAAGRCSEDVTQQAQQAQQAGEERHDAEGQQQDGDNSSFYGSDSNSSSQEGGDSASCSSSDRSSDEAGEGGEGSGGEGQESERCGGGAPRGLWIAGPSTHSPALQGAGGSGQPGVVGQQRRQRLRDRWRPGRRGGGGGAAGEIPAGPVPEWHRRRSEVGSVLEPEPHSDTEDAEVALAAPGLHA